MTAGATPITPLARIALMPDAVTPARDAADPVAALTRGVASGDPAALAALYELYFEFTLRAARGVTRRDESFCLDVAQEAWLRVARSLSPCDGTRHFEAWLARVVRTAALDILRREVRRRARERRRAAPDQTVRPADRSAAEELAWVRDRIAELEGADGDLFRSRFALDRSLDQAGRSAGLSGDAAHGRLRRLVARLRSAASEVFRD
jgi:RNA polymerase sigma factor (sigma-70 family)